MELITTSQFRKDLKKIKRPGLDLGKLKINISRLLNEEDLDARYRDQALIGNYSGFRECHIEADWLLIYAVDSQKLILKAVETISHSDLF